MTAQEANERTLEVIKTQEKMKPYMEDINKAIEEGKFEVSYNEPIPEDIKDNLAAMKFHFIVAALAYEPKVYKVSWR